MSNSENPFSRIIEKLRRGETVEIVCTDVDTGMCEKDPDCVECQQKR